MTLLLLLLLMIMLLLLLEGVREEGGSCQVSARTSTGLLLHRGVVEEGVEKGRVGEEW